MTAPVRRAGVAILDDGSEVVWTVADGRRGRRWRVMTRRDGAIDASLLLEVDLEGRVSRLELATGDGLLTLHPEAMGALHGNVVTSGGVRHLTLAWSDGHELEVAPLAVSAAVTAARLAGFTPVGEGIVVPVVVVEATLGVREATRRYVRRDAATWDVERDGRVDPVTLDDRGIPIWSGGVGEDPATEWPLELGSDG